MSNYIDLFIINQINDVEIMNVNEGTVNSLTSDTINVTSLNVDSGSFDSLISGTISCQNCNVNNNLNFHSSSTLSKGEYVYTLQDKTGTIAFLDDIKIPENMVTTDTEQTITGKKTFNNTEITFTGYVKTEGLKLNAGSFQFNDFKIFAPLRNGSLVVWGDMVDYMTLKNVDQIVDGTKTFSLRTKFMNGFNNGTYNIDLQNKAVTLALVSDLDNYVTVNNVNQSISGYKTFSNLVTFQNGISNGLYNYTFTSKSGRLLIDDDIKNMVIQDDIKNMVIQDDIKDMVVHDDIKNVAVKDDLLNLVTLNTNQDILSVKSFENTVYFNQNVFVKYDKKIQTGDLKCLYNANIDGVATVNDLVVNNNLEINGGNSKTLSSKYTDLNASVSKIILFFDLIIFRANAKFFFNFI